MNHELEKTVIGTLILNPILIDDHRIEGEWIRGGYEEYLKWIRETFEQNPAGKIILDTCPFDSEPLLACIPYNDPLRLPSALESLKNRFLKTEISTAASDMLKDIDTLEPLVNISKASQRLNRISEMDCQVDEPHVSAHIESTLDILVQRMQRFREGKEIGISTGLPELDSFIGGWERKQNVVVGGRAGMGKTTSALKFGLAAARKGHTVDIYSLEMDRHKLLCKFCSEITNIDLKTITKGFFRDDQYIDIQNAMSELIELPIFIHDDKMNWAEIRSSARAINKEFDSALVIFDYLQLIRPDQKFGNRQEEVSYVSREIKKLSMQADCCTMPLCQLSRAVEQRASKRPMLSDLRESGAIEQDADMVVFPYRPSYYEPDDDQVYQGTEFIIAKDRMGGEVGTVTPGQQNDNFIGDSWNFTN